MQIFYVVDLLNLHAYMAEKTVKTLSDFGPAEHPVWVIDGGAYDLSKFLHKV